MKKILENFQNEIEEIKDKVEYSKLENEYKKYTDIKDKVKLIIKHLKNGISDLDSVSKKVVNGYSVNGESGDDDFLENTRKDIKSTYNYLSYTILPDIEKKIKELSDEMEKIN